MEKFTQVEVTRQCATLFASNTVYAIKKCVFAMISTFVANTQAFWHSAGTKITVYKISRLIKNFFKFLSPSVPNDVNLEEKICEKCIFSINYKYSPIFYILISLYPPWREK